MMTKKILFGTMTAAMLLVGSCTNELDVVAPEGGEATVTVGLDIPQKQMGSRAYSDGTTAQRLQYAVYEITTAGSEKTYTLMEGSDYNKTGDAADEIQLQKEINFKLLTGRTYGFVFWADNEASPYSVEFGANDVNMTVTNTKLKANDETLDAFFAYEELKVNGDAKLDAHLYRPFAQVNVGTNDLTQAEELGMKVAKTKVMLSGKTTLNLITGETGAGNTSYTFDFNDLPKDEVFPVVGYEYMAMVYILEPKEKEDLYSVSFTYQLDNGTDSGSKSILSVPVQRNYRTNIYGQLLTSNVDVNVIIEPDYNSPDYEADPWRVAMAFGGTIQMQEDKDISSSLLFNNSVVLDLNGHDINTSVPTGSSSTGAIRVNAGANLTIIGSGNLTSSTGTPIVTANGGTITIKGGTFTNKNGHCVYAYNSDSKIVIENGYFDSGNEWPLNIYDPARANCEPIDLIEVRGGTFVNFDPSNNESEGPRTNYVPEGYKVIMTDEDAQKLYTVVPANTIEINNENSNLAGAIADLATNGTKDATIFLSNGTYSLKASPNTSLPTWPSDTKITFLGSGKEKTILNNADYFTGSGCELVLSDLTLKVFENSTNHTALGFKEASKVTLTNVDIYGEFHAFSGDVTFENCNFYYGGGGSSNGSRYGLYVETAGKTVISGCTFDTSCKVPDNSTETKGILVYSDQGNTEMGDIDISNTKFVVSGTKSTKAAIEIHSEKFEKAGTLNISNVTVTEGDFQHGLWREINNSSSDATQYFTVIVDGVVKQTAAN